jgi:hypothetical protein
LIDGHWYSYLVTSERVNGKVMQRVVCYLGLHESVKAAHAYWVRESKKPGRKTHATKMVKLLEPYL